MTVPNVVVQLLLEAAFSDVIDLITAVRELPTEELISAVDKMKESAQDGRVFTIKEQQEILGYFQNCVKELATTKKALNDLTMKHQQDLKNLKGSRDEQRA